MPSGAGRTVTRRDLAASSIRRTTDAASSSAATRRAARPAAATPSLPSNGPTRRSTSARSSTASVEVAWTTAIACRSPITPLVSACIVDGISWTRARDIPTKRSPSVGDSRRASATSEPTDRAVSCRAACSRDRRTRSVARAWVAEAAPLIRSSSATRSTRSRSLRVSTSTEDSHARTPATCAGTPRLVATSGASPLCSRSLREATSTDDGAVASPATGPATRPAEPDAGRCVDPWSSRGAGVGGSTGRASEHRSCHRVPRPEPLLAKHVPLPCRNRTGVH